MESDIVPHHVIGIVEVARHCVSEFNDRSRFVVGAAQCGEGDRAHLDRAPHVVDLLNRDLLGVHRVIENEAKHVRVDRRDPGAPSAADIDKLESRERAERFADDRP